LIILSCSFAAGDDIIITGVHSVRYKIKTPNPQVFTNYINNGYTQTVSSPEDNTIEVNIKIRADEFKSYLRYPLDYQIPTWLKPYTLATDEIQSEDRDICSLARSLAKGCEYQYQVVERILKWVSENITYHLDPHVPRAAREVLYSKRGYCIGYSNLSLALLRAVGIPCRNVHGIYFDRMNITAPDQYNAVSLNGVMLHRWIEVYYPDVGWVFSDPHRCINHLNGCYIYLAHQNAGGDYNATKIAGTEIKIKEEKNMIAYIDLIETNSRMLFLRPSIFKRKSSMVEVWLLNDPLPEGDYEVVLSSLEQVLRSAPNEEGKTRFVGLQSGEYELKIRYNGELKYITNFSLERTQEMRYDVLLEPEEGTDEKL